MSTFRGSKWSTQSGATGFRPASSRGATAAASRKSLFALPSSKPGHKQSKFNRVSTAVYLVFGTLFSIQLLVFMKGHSMADKHATIRMASHELQRQRKHHEHDDEHHSHQRIRTKPDFRKRGSTSSLTGNQQDDGIRRTSTVHIDPSTSLFKTSGQVEEAKVLRKTGQVVNRAITSVNKNDLGALLGGGQQQQQQANVTYEQALVGREHIVAILNDAGVTDMDTETILSLPEYSSVTKLYGDGPVVIGLERCQEFREKIPLDDASIGTAGMFNTGTNPFAMYIEENCIMPHNTHDVHGGTRWQVPWGKHALASTRLGNTAGHDKKTNKTNVMPIVLVRDPYSWMQSMCKHPYAAKWPHSKDHCPNLIPNEHDRNHENPSVHVNVKFNSGVEEYESLAHLWTAWNRQYYDADYPRLMVRFEDLQFHAREMIDIVCQCAGAVARKDDAKFTYIVDAAKWGPGHTKQSQTNLISAMIKYGSDTRRFSTMTKEDIKFASQALDPELMHLFQYEQPEVR